jgi:hypothetical protein
MPLAIVPVTAVRLTAVKVSGRTMRNSLAYRWRFLVYVHDSTVVPMMRLPGNGLA